jgi:hypothetical protein
MRVEAEMVRLLVLLVLYQIVGLVEERKACADISGFWHRKPREGIEISECMLGCLT